MKKGIRNLKLVTIGIALLTLLNTQNIILQKFITLEDDVELTGAGFTESTVKLWGYRIFAVVIVASIFTAIKYFKQYKHEESINKFSYSSSIFSFIIL